MRRSAAGHDHSTEHLTDVSTRRVYASSGDGYAAIGWDYPGSTLLEVRILRSDSGFAPTAGGDAAEDVGVAAAAAGQTVVYHDVTGSFRDAGLQNGRSYFYTVFARHPGREWVRWGEYELRPGVPATAVAGRLPAIFRRLFHRVLPAAAVLLFLAAIAAPGSALAAGGEAEPTPDAQAIAAAAADPAVAAVLQGTTYKTSVASWGGSQDAPAGATVTFTWPVAEARSAAGVWPLLKSDDGGTPVPPYATVEHRVRLTDLTALQVDVLQDGRVIQILPLDGETQFELLEETWPPFSWFPWFTARPWALLPVFLLIGAIVIARAWRRSRAWNRRLPSMTRHDRQFIGRLAIILFLVAGFAWQVYEAIYAARAPAVDPGGLNAGDLAALPLLLFPPALFLAALAMELTPTSSGHRVAWGLVAFLAAAGSVYNLATAITGTTTNLNLSYYILLGVLCLLAAPRSFSAARMGWSRNNPPHYA
jgi:hypothetical protein